MFFRSQFRGFTLPELLVAIAIMAILATLAVYDFSHTQRNARDGRRKGDVSAIAASLTQYTSVTGSSFIRYNKQTCNVPPIADPESFSADVQPATGDGCTGASGRSFGKMNLISADTDGYGPYTKRTYPSRSMMEALNKGGFLATASVDPSTPNGFHTDPTMRDYVLVRACSSGWENVGVGGSIFAVWTSLENVPSDQDIANAAVLAGGSKAGPVSQGSSYVFDFGSEQSEYTAGFFTAQGYAYGSATTKASPNGHCSND